MKFKCWNPRSKAVLKKDGKEVILEVATKGEARHQFKKLFGETPANCTGTRKRLPVGHRVARAA